jgi:hypothetical protein
VSEHVEAQSYAERALKSFRAGEIRKTKALFWAANSYNNRAQRDAKELKELNGRIAEMLGRGVTTGDRCSLSNNRARPFTPHHSPVYEITAPDLPVPNETKEQGCGNAHKG